MFDAATKTLTDSGYVSVRQERVTAADSAGLIVAQQPLAGTPADSGGVDTLFVGAPAQKPPDTATGRIPPPVDSVQVPNLVGRPSKSAGGTLRGLRLNIATRMVNDGNPKQGQLVVDSQLPVAMTRVPVGTTVTLILLAPDGHHLWLLVIIGVVLLAAAVTIMRVRARRPLRAMKTVSHADNGIQSLKATGVHDPAESELKHLGFAVTVTADPGSQHLRVPQPPPARDERTDG
jgi:hypothetical protein